MEAVAFGENGLWLARSRPPCKGYYHLPQVVKQAYQGGMELFYFWQIGSKGYERLAYSGRFANDTCVGGTCTVRERGGT